MALPQKNKKGEAVVPASPRLSFYLRDCGVDPIAPDAPSVDRGSSAVALQIVSLPCSPRCLSGCGSYAFGGDAIVLPIRAALSCTGSDRLPARSRGDKGRSTRAWGGVIPREAG